MLHNPPHPRHRKSVIAFLLMLVFATPVHAQMDALKDTYERDVYKRQISETMSQVFSYVKSLDDSNMFKEAKTKSTSTKKDNGNDVAAFEIEFKVKDSTSPITKESA